MANHTSQQLSNNTLHNIFVRQHAPLNNTNTNIALVPGITAWWVTVRESGRVRARRGGQGFLGATLLHSPPFPTSEVHLRLATNTFPLYLKSLIGMQQKREDHTVRRASHVFLRAKSIPFTSLPRFLGILSTLSSFSQLLRDVQATTRLHKDPYVIL